MNLANDLKSFLFYVYIFISTKKRLTYKLDSVNLHYYVLVLHFLDILHKFREMLGGDP